MLQIIVVAQLINDHMTIKKRKPHPEDESLVELLHGTLKLAALVLPLLIVTYRLYRGALPCGGSRYMIHKINPPHLVNAPFPAEYK